MLALGASLWRANFERKEQKENPLSPLWLTGGRRQLYKTSRSREFRLKICHSLESASFLQKGFLLTRKWQCWVVNSSCFEPERRLSNGVYRCECLVWCLCWCMHMCVPSGQVTQCPVPSLESASHWTWSYCLWFSIKLVTKHPCNHTHLFRVDSLDPNVCRAFVLPASPK